MAVYVVSLTEDGRWHCFDLSGDIPMCHLVGKGYYEMTASRLIRDLVIGSENPWHEARDRHQFACAIHAGSRYQAIKLAKQYYSSHKPKQLDTGNYLC